MGETRKRKKLQNSELNFKDIFKRCVIFTVIFFLISIITTAIIGAIFYNTKDPTSKIAITSLLSLYLSSFISGFILSKINKQRYFLGGLILGILLFIITFVAGIIIDSKESFELGSIIWRLLIPVVCILGSMLGIKKDTKHKHNR